MPEASAAAAAVGPSRRLPPVGGALPAPPRGRAHGRLGPKASVAASLVTPVPRPTSGALDARLGVARPTKGATRAAFLTTEVTGATLTSEPTRLVARLAGPPSRPVAVANASASLPMRSAVPTGPQASPSVRRSPTPAIRLPPASVPLLVATVEAVTATEPDLETPGAQPAPGVAKAATPA